MQPGDYIGSHQLVRLIGEGGMGQVWEVQRIEFATFPFDRREAMKIILPQSNLAMDSQYRDLFAREVRMAAAINHPNVLPIWDCGTNPVLWFLMPLLEGANLGDLIATHGDAFCDDMLVTTLIVQMLEALIAIHEAGILHRDIKPSNLFLTKAGNLFLLDFGIARPIIPTGQTILTTLKGTPGYQAPEMLRGERATVQSDLFAAGCLAFYMLAGEVLFQGDTAEARWAATLEKKSNPLLNELSEHWEWWIRRMTNHHPEDRVQSANEALEGIPSYRGKHLFILPASAIVSRLAAHPKIASPTDATQSDAVPTPIPSKAERVGKLRAATVPPDK